MNRVHRVIWSRSQQIWVVASELARGATKSKRGGHARKALVSPALIGALFMATSPAQAANYLVATEAEMRQAVINANLDGDASSTITLTADIVITDPASFAQVTKSLTIDTSTFGLSTPTAAGVSAGASLSFLGGPLVVSGALDGGNAAALTSNGKGGAGLAMSGGSVENQASVTGGDGGSTQRSSHTTGGVGGSGAQLTNSTLVNRGTITGGLGGGMNGQGSHGAGVSRAAGAGGIGASLTGGNLDNRGSIVGGTGGLVTNVPGGADNTWGGSGGIGAALIGGTHSNSGSISGGIGGPGANQGGGAGAGIGGVGVTMSGNATLVNQAGAAITGGSGTISLTGGGPPSPGGYGADITSATMQNFGTITGGSSAGANVYGAVGVFGRGNATVINDGSIVGGTSSVGTLRNSAVSFTGGNNLLELRSNFSFTGQVVGAASDTLALGGSTDASFAVSQIGPAAQYRNFGSYRKVGTSTWTLTGTTTAVTPWSIRDGVLSVSAEGNLGATSGALTLDGGTLEVTGTGYAGTSRVITAATDGGIDIDNAAHSFNVASTINGAGGLRKLGDGTLVFSADNTYSGETTISAGTLQLGNGGTTGNIGSATLSNDASLAINRSNDLTLAAAISGSGSVSQVGAGITTLSGANTYSGGTTIGAGTLRGSTVSFGSGAILDDSALVLEQDVDGTLSNLISGTGSVTKQGAGALAFSAANSYLGATTVSAGTLLINGNQSAASGTTTVQAGATLGGVGTIGGNVVNDGTIAAGAGGAGTLAILGDLTLGAGSLLDFELGSPNVVGGSFNDLLDVQGDLTLDGTLNVTVAAGGSYGPGFYRLIKYNGSLIDNSLELGTMPAGTQQVLQTVTPGQVNLINTQGVVLRWWDGDAGIHHDGVIAGGDGTWQADAMGSNINWTDASGTPNGAFLDSSFAMFTNAAGTVTVDDTLGAVRVAGMQFTVNGYRIEGDSVALGLGTNVIRVGDGTAAGAGMDATIASAIIGNGRLDKGDLGTLTLTGANNYSGGTTISAGTLQLGDGGTTGSITGSVLNNGTLAFDRADAVNFGGVISGTGAVSQIGSGSTTLGGVNTYGGGTTIASGTLIGSATSFGSGDIVDNAALIVNQPVNGELVNAISGTGSLTKQGAGVLTSTGNNTHTGLTTISAGTLRLGNGGTSGSLVGDVVNNGVLAFNRSDASTYAGDIFSFGDVAHQGTGVTTLTGDSEISGLAVNAGELRFANGAEVTIQGVLNEDIAVGGAGSTLTLTGPGTSLTTVVIGQQLHVGDRGTVNIADGAALSANAIQLTPTSVSTLNVSGANTVVESSSAITVSASAPSSSLAEVNVTNGATVIAAEFDVGSLASAGADARTVVSGVGTSWTNTGQLRLLLGSLDILDGATFQASTARIGGYDISAATHDASMRVAGEGSNFTITGAVNVGSSDTTSGLVTLADGGHFVAGGDLVLGQVAGSTGTFNIGAAGGDAAQRAGTLDVSGIVFGPGTGTLVFNHTDDDYVLDETLAGTGAINHVAGTTALIGNGSAFAGTTDVSGGTLIVGRDGIGSLGDASSTVNVANGATLGGSGVIGGAVSVVDGGRIAPGNSPGTLTMGSLSLSSGSILDFELGARNVVGGTLNDLINVNGNLTLDGVLNISEPTGGAFDVGVYRLVNYTGAFTDNGLALGTLPAGTNPVGIVVQTEVADQVNLINTASLQFRFWDGPNGHGNGQFDGNDGVWLATGDSNWTVFDPFANGAWTDAAFAVFQGTPGTVVVDDSVGDVGFSGAQFLVDGYTINGPDSLNTDVANTVIRVGDGTAVGGTMTAAINTVIAGSGGIVKADAGTLVLGADNTYTGGTRINGGTLQLGNGGTTGSIVAGDITNDGTLAFNHSDAVAFSGEISGSGSVAQIGGGTTTLADINSYEGGTTVTAGTLAGTAHSFGDGGITNDGTLRIDQATDAEMANVFSGNGTVVKQGGGSLDLSGDSSSFSGSTNVTDGSLRVNGVLGDATSTVSVSNGATLGGAGTIGGSVAVADGRLAAGNSPGTLNIGGNLTLDAASVLDFELGEVGVVGGSLNDLINVGGDLVLDGTLDVTQSAGGQYGSGVYRLINYTGTLTNNGLIVGASPLASQNYVQTSVAQQVNLVNTQGLLLRYWDGPSGVRNNATIEGGNGVWLSHAGNDNWTVPDGTINGGYQDGAFAVFTGASGTVSVDDSLGAIHVSGMQFATDGYRIEGDSISLLTGSNTIRVGDGSSTGANFLATISSELIGAGMLDKNDLGTLVLTGANTYSGGTTISAGTLRIGDGGTSGSVVGGISNQGALAFDRSDVTTFGGVVSGTGVLSQMGSGTTTLTGVNTYTGETRIDAGTLALSGTGSIAVSSRVVADGTLDVSATSAGASITTLSGSGEAVLGAQALTLTAATGSFDGVVSGASSGTLNKAGAGTWNLTGTGSEVGTLNVQAGTLAVAVAGDIAANTTSVATGATLRNDGAFTGTAGGDAFTLAGAAIGEIHLLDGDDRVVLANGADFTQATFDGGLGSDTLDLTHSSALTLPAALSVDIEHLIKRGSGVLTLGGTVDAYSDSIELREGSTHLAAANAITNEVRIESGATLTGTGAISGRLVNGGLLSVGNSPGVLQVGGTYLQSSSGTRISEIRRDGTDLLDVTGAATLGGTNRIQIQYGLYLDGTTHTLLQADGGITGAYNLVEINPSALMRADHRISGSAETVSFTRLPTITVTDPNTNRGRYANWLDEQVTQGGLSSTMIDYIDTLLEQPTAEQASDLLGSIAEPSAGVVHNNISVLVADFSDGVFDRFASDTAQCTTSQATNDALNCAWMRGLRQWGDASGDEFGPSYDWDIGGAQFGFDRKLDAWTLGFTFGYAETDTQHENGGRGELRSKMVGLYTSYSADRLGLDAVVVRSWNESETRRDSAHAEFDANSYGGGARLSYRLSSGSGPLVRPFIGVLYDRIDGTQFAEIGGGDGNVVGRLHDREGLRGIAGLQLADNYEGYGRVFRPSLEIGVVHQFMDTQSTLDLQLSPLASGAGAFRAYGVDLDRTAVAAEAALSVSLSERASVALGYGGEVAKDFSHHELSLSFRVVW